MTNWQRYDIILTLHHTRILERMNNLIACNVIATSYTLYCHEFVFHCVQIEPVLFPLAMHGKGICSFQRTSKEPWISALCHLPLLEKYILHIMKNIVAIMKLICCCKYEHHSVYWNTDLNCCIKCCRSVTVLPLCGISIWKVSGRRLFIY